jgi:hypothetical protein
MRVIEPLQQLVRVLFASKEDVGFMAFERA